MTEMKAEKLVEFEESKIIFKRGKNLSFEWSEFILAFSVIV